MGDRTATWQPNGGNPLFHPVVGGRWSPEPTLPDGSPYPTMGFAASAWIQVKCGLKLDPWQVELLRRAFLYHPDTLDWVVEDIVVVGPEGIGKSAFFAGIGIWLLDGPCMPPVEQPRRHDRPNIPVVSAAISLTEHIHRHAKAFITRDGSPLAGRLEVENTRIFRVEQPAHAIRFPAGSGAYQQGSEPVPAILEEELHVLNAPGVKATGIEAVKITSSKRTKNANPKVQRFTITNPDTGDPDSLLGQRWRYASRVLDGEVDDPSLLAIHYHAAWPADGDIRALLDDPQRLRQAVAEASPSTWMDVDAIARKWEKGEFGLGWYVRFSLGLFYAGDDQVFGDGVLEGAIVSDVDLRTPPPPDVRCALAFDGARNRDTVALTGCTPEQYGWTVELWERPDGADESWRYDKLGIYWRVVQAMDVDHPHALLAVDPTWFEDYVHGFDGVGPDGQPVHLPGWAKRWPDRVVLDVQQQGAQAWTAFRRAVIDGSYSWDGDPRMLRHMRNAKELTRTSHGRQYTVLAKRRDDGAHPIDLLVAATYAHRLATVLAPDDTDPDDLDAWRAALGVPT